MANKYPANMSQKDKAFYESFEQIGPDLITPHAEMQAIGERVAGLCKQEYQEKGTKNFTKKHMLEFGIQALQERYGGNCQ